MVTIKAIIKATLSLFLFIAFSCYILGPLEWMPVFGKFARLDEAVSLEAFVRVTAFYLVPVQLFLWGVDGFGGLGIIKPYRDFRKRRAKELNP